MLWLSIANGLICFTVFQYYASEANAAERVLRRSVAVGDYTWTVNSPNGDLVPSRCLALANAEWVRHALVTSPLGPNVAAAGGEGIEVVAYMGSLAAIDGGSNGPTSTGIAAGVGVLDRFPSKRLEVTGDRVTYVTVVVDKAIADVRFPELANSLLVATPLATADRCIVELDPGSSVDIERVVDTWFDADRIVVARHRAQYLAEFELRRKRANASAVIATGVAVSLLLSLLPAVVDRREKGLLITLGWSRMSVALMRQVPDVMSALVGFLLATSGGGAASLLLGHSEASTRLGARAALLVLCASLVLGSILSLLWVARSARSLLLAQ